MNLLIPFLLCFSLTIGKYSYFDKCYRFDVRMDELDTLSYQLYINRKGIPLGNDYIIYQDNPSDGVLALSYYYHYVVNTCTLSEDRYVCESVCESVWFKVWNVTAAGPYGETCDPAFLGQYGNILEHTCNMGGDPFSIVRKAIGQKKEEIIKLKGKEPVIPEGFTKVNKCIWESTSWGCSR